MAAKDYIPDIFSVETVLSCNLKCPGCAIGLNIIKRPKKHMTFDEYKIIADKIKPFARYVFLHIWGDPMLNKDIFSIIEYTQKFAQSNICTNAMMLSKDLCEKLILSGTDISVSIDGYSQQVYERYRVGGNVTKAFKALKNLKFFHDKYQNKSSLRAQMIIFKHNEHEIDAFTNACDNIGVEYCLKTATIGLSDVLEQSTIKEYQRSPCQNWNRLDCNDAKKVFTILVDGSVVICCYDYDGTVKYGNIFDNDVLDIWNSDNCLQIRESVISGEAPDFCKQNCLLYNRRG